jgi:V/A-type H+-transporting ATPase subunit C
MLLDVMKYSFINAKIRAMKGRLVKDTVFQQLLDTTHLDAFTKVLLETDYADELAGVDLKSPEISEVIEALDRNLVRYYGTILTYFTAGNENRFIRLLLSRIEIENLKIIIRGKFKGITSVMIADNLIPTDGVSALNFEELVTSKDVEHFVALLARTRYEKPLKRALPIFERDRRTAVLEYPLDILYYLDLAKAIKTLSSADYRVTKMFLGTFCDITNIITILRGRLFFNMGPDEVMTLYIPFGYRLTKTEAVTLSKVGEDDFREVLARTHYGKRVLTFTQLSDLEMGLNVILLGMTKKVLLGYPFHIGTVTGFIALKETEVANLKSIAEGKRHALGEAEIRESLVR